MYHKNSKNWLKHWDFVLIDMFCMEMSFFGAYFFRHKNEVMIHPQMYLRIGILLIVLDLVVILINNSYAGIVQRTKWLELKAVIKHITMIELILILYEYMIKETDDLSRKVFFFSWGASILLCWSCRIVWKEILRYHLLKRDNQSNMLVISTLEQMDKCIEKLQKKTYRGFEISGVAILEETRVLDNQAELYIKKISQGKNISYIKGYDALIEYIRQEIVDEVFIDTFKDKEELEKLVKIFLGMGITVHIGMDFLPDELPNKFMESIGAHQAVTSAIKTASTLEICIKRMMDIFGALVGLLITGIAYVFVAPAIKKESPGPVFFKQERIGKNGRVFYIYKFRSMYLDAEERKNELMKQNEMQGLMFKMEKDPRIIGSEKGSGKGIGNFIRKTSIDELPQFWNILKGDMSLVGTRPPTKNEYEQYELHHKIRLSMKPGLTGVWQTSGRNEITDFEEIVKLDRYYIENWSLWLDIKLILKTVKVVVERKGSK